MTYSTIYTYVYYVIMSDLVLYEIYFLVHLQLFYVEIDSLRFICGWYVKTLFVLGSCRNKKLVISSFIISNDVLVYTSFQTGNNLPAIE